MSTSNDRLEALDRGKLVTIAMSLRVLVAIRLVNQHVVMTQRDVHVAISATYVELRQSENQLAGV